MGDVLLRPVERADVPLICTWRAAAEPYLRTPFLISLEQQMRFFETEMQDRHAHSRYWIVAHEREPVGIAALTGIEWENGLCECSIILAPEWQRHGIGTQVFEQLKRHAFYTLRLQMVIAEVYEHNPALKFWVRQASAHRTIAGDQLADSARLKRRKFNDGTFHDSIVFQFQYCPYVLTTQRAARALDGAVNAANVLMDSSIRSEPGFSYYQSSDHK